MIANVHFPSKTDILQFLERHPSMQDPWFKANPKVLDVAAERFQNKDKAPLGVRMRLDLTMADLQVIPPGDLSKKLCDALIECAQTSKPAASATASSPAATSENKTIDLQSIGQQIKEIDKLTIEIIGIKICEAVLNRLGPIEKAKVQAQVMEKKGKANDPTARMLMALALMSAKAPADNKKEFMDYETFARFSNAMLWPIKKELEQIFQIPKTFLKDGCHFQFSEYEPIGILQEVAKEIRFTFTPNDVPHKYSVALSFDEKRSQEQSKLIISLKEISDGIVIEEASLDIENLLKEFRASL